MLLDNFLVRTDSYKHSHSSFFPPGASGIFSYLEARDLSKGGRVDNNDHEGKGLLELRYSYGNTFPSNIKGERIEC